MKNDDRTKEHPADGIGQYGGELNQGGLGIEGELYGSEKLYRVLYEEDPSMYFAVDAEEIVISINNFGAKQLGYKVEELIGQSIFRVIYEEDKKILKQQIKMCLQNPGSIASQELRKVRKDGSILWVKEVVRSVQAADGMIITLIVCEDITRLKQAEQELRESEARYRSLVENVRDIIFTISRDLTVTSLNPAFETITGWQREQWLGKNLKPLVHPDDLPLAMEIYRRVLDGEESPGFELRIRSRSGDYIITESIITLQIQDGRIISTLGIARDITKRRRAEEELQMAHDELEIRVRERTAELARANEALQVEIAGRRKVEEQIKRSEEKYKNIVELTTDIIYTSDRAGNQVFMNSAGYRLLETAPEEVLGKSWLRWIHPDDRETTLKKFMEMIEQDVDIFGFENRYVSKGGRVINALHNIRVLRSEEGKVIGTQGIARDITGHKKAEEQLRFQTTVLSQVNDAVIAFDNKHSIIYWNDGAQRLYGWKSGEVLGRQVEEVTRHRWLKPEDEREAYSSLESTGSWRGEFIQTRKSGEEIDVEASIRVLRDERGETLGFIAVMRDITERRRIEMRLRLLSAAVEEAPNGIQIVDLDGRIIFSNKAVKTIYGFSPEEFRGKHVNEMNADPELASRVIIPAIKETGRWIGEIMVRHKDGRIFPILLNACMIKDSRGEPIAMVGIITDITERKRAEEERERWAAELARSNAELEQFAYTASHDLQEPLRMVSGFTQLLAKRYKGRLGRDADEFISFIVDGIARMQRVIEDLLAYSRVGTRGKPFEPTDCEDILNQAMTNLKVAIEENKAKVTHDTLPTVMADPTQMVQLFQNLISNAIKFRKKEEPPRIHITAQRRGNEWVFPVRDNGIGISPEFKSYLFQIFQREHAASEYPGTGIGLAICKKIVERHGGRIWAESVQGEGSTFYFTMPVRKSD
ncbi:MAG: PAS domain S-box protein [Candidatus Methanoperedens sp.]|nr:PAS domain S-box protein [Candidatus Methanoperedens sp.]